MIIQSRKQGSENVGCVPNGTALLEGGHLRYLIIIIALIGYVFIGHQIAESNSSEFVLTFDCGSDKNYQLCLIGNFPLSKTVNLLSRMSSSTCKTKTLKSFNYTEGPYGPEEVIPATPVEIKNCKQPGQYHLAYLGENVLEYRPVQLEQNITESTIATVDNLIRKKRLITRKDEEFYLNGLSKKPILYVPITKTKNIYITHYVLNQPPRPGMKLGPLFFYSNGKITKIDSEAIINKTFKLNDRYFVLLNHTCWAGCGDIYTTLLEIKGNRFKTIFKDATWAD